MPKFLVRERRPMWVCFAQVVEAPDEDTAIDTFYNEFDPDQRVLEDYVQRVDPGPVSVRSADGRTSEDFPIDDWKYEVENGDTRLGYAEWLASKTEIAEDD